MSHYSGVSQDFTLLMETLLAGKAICEYSYQRLHRLLSDEQGIDRARAEEMLEALGRELHCSSGIFYAVYIGMDQDVHKNVEEQFGRYLQHVSVVTEFFDILRLAKRSGEVFETGDYFGVADALNRISSEVALVERLLRLVSLISQIKNPTPDAALRRVVDWLTNEGYLALSSASEMQYVITGEFALFNQWLNFALEQEGVNLESEELDPIEGEGEEEAVDDSQQDLFQ